MRLYFARHGQTPSSAERRLRKDDEPLSDDGIAEAERAARKLQEELGAKRLHRIIVSPRARTKETAKIFARIFGFDEDRIEEDPRLAERDCMPYAGQLIADVFSQSEEALIAGCMEPEKNVFARTEELYNEIARTTKDDEAVLFVGHSTALKPLAYIAQGKPIDAEVEMPPMQPDNVLRLDDLALL